MCQQTGTRGSDYRDLLFSVEGVQGDRAHGPDGEEPDSAAVPAAHLRARHDHGQVSLLVLRDAAQAYEEDPGRDRPVSAGKCLELNSKTYKYKND